MGFFSRAMGIPDPPDPPGQKDRDNFKGEAQDKNKRPPEDKGKAKRHYEKMEKEVEKNEGKDEPRDGKLW